MSVLRYTVDRQYYVKKLLNTSFEKLKSSKSILTRQQAKEIGIRSPANVEIASGFKFQDAVLLSKCISTTAICSSCRQASSKLELYQRNNEREGLCESLFLKCSSCSVETPLATRGGKGQLTDKTIDKMQNFYVKAIRENKGNVEGMKNSIKAIQHHMIKNEGVSLHVQHKYCPNSSDIWCKYWKDENEGTSLYNEDNHLSHVFMDQLQQIFTRLSNHDLLSRCLKGMTQNQNEAANGILWSKCPKTKFCGARRVRIAVCETVAVYNTGAASKAMVMTMCGITPGENSMRALRKQDRVRALTAAKQVTLKYKDQRRKLRAMRKSKGDKNSYLPGGFSLSSQPDVQVKENKKKRKRAVEPSIKFVMSTMEVVGKKKRMN